MTEGKLLICINWDGNVRGVEIQSTRNFSVNRLLAGRQPQQAIDMIPLIYSLCGKAQGVAACMAAELAQGHQPSQGILLLRARLVMLEAAQEYLWKLFLDWPQWAGMEPLPHLLAPMRNRLDATLRSLQQGSGWNTIAAPAPDACVFDAWDAMLDELESFLSRLVFGMECSEWLDIVEESSLARWMQTSPTITARALAAVAPGACSAAGKACFMPSPAAQWWRDEILPIQRQERDFSRQPSWNGQPLETGAACRMQRDLLIAAVTETQGFGLFSRALARLRELAQLPERLRETTQDWVAAFSVRAGEGLACVETARGLLVHRMELHAGTVAAFQIVAPTEWNFHPHGPFQQALCAVKADNEDMLRQRAHWLAQAFDPCVAYEITVNHA